MARKKRPGEGPGTSGGPLPRTREFYLLDSMPKPPVSSPRKEKSVQPQGKNKPPSKSAKSLQVRSNLLDMVSTPHPPLASVDRPGQHSGVDRPGAVETASLDATAGAALAQVGAAHHGTVKVATLDATVEVELAQTGAAQPRTVEVASLNEPTILSREGLVLAQSCCVIRSAFQCEREYHVGCLRDYALQDLKELPSGKWFCCSECYKINHTLQQLIEDGGQQIPDPLLNIIKEKHASKDSKDVKLDVKWQLLNGKMSSVRHVEQLLSDVIFIFHEKFSPIVTLGSNTDFIPCMVYGKDLEDRDFQGMHCAVLTVK